MLVIPSSWWEKAHCPQNIFTGLDVLQDVFVAYELRRTDQRSSKYSHEDVGGRNRTSVWTPNVTDHWEYQWSSSLICARSLDKVQESQKMLFNLIALGRKTVLENILSKFTVSKLDRNMPVAAVLEVSSEVGSCRSRSPSTCVSTTYLREQYLRGSGRILSEKQHWAVCSLCLDFYWSTCWSLWIAVWVKSEMIVLCQCFIQALDSKSLIKGTPRVKRVWTVDWIKAGQYFWHWPPKGIIQPTFQWRSYIGLFICFSV